MRRGKSRFCQHLGNTLFSNCCIAALLHCCIAALLHCCIVALLHCCIAAMFLALTEQMLRCWSIPQCIHRRRPRDCGAASEFGGHNTVAAAEGPCDILQEPQVARTECGWCKLNGGSVSETDLHRERESSAATNGGRPDGTREPNVPCREALDSDRSNEGRHFQIARLLRCEEKSPVKHETVRKVDAARKYVLANLIHASR